MVLPSLLASPSSTSSPTTPRILSSRRPGGRGGGTVIIPPNRPPVLLQITNSTIRAGTVTDAAPKRVFPYKIVDPSALQSSSSSSLEEEALYRFWAPLLQDVYDNLGQDTKDRRAVVLLPDPTIESDQIRTTTRKVILRVLFDVIGVPSVSLQPELAFLPYAFPMLSTMLVVHVTPQTGSSFVHSKDRSLPFTFQTVPLLEEESPVAASSIISNEWTPRLQRQFLDASYPNSLIFAILKTLESCPLPLRRDAIQNIVFSGEGIVYRPDVPIRVARHIKRILEQGKLPEEEQQPEQEPGPYPAVLQMVPISLSLLKPLASWVGLIDTGATVAPYHRADLLGWLGASLFAAHCSHNNPDAFSWITNTTSD